MLGWWMVEMVDDSRIVASTNHRRWQQQVVFWNTEGKSVDVYRSVYRYPAVIWETDSRSTGCQSGKFEIQSVVP